MTESSALQSAPVAAPTTQKVVIVMPAYNAARTLEDTVRAIPKGFYDEIVVVDDHSRDDTQEKAQALNLKVIRHPHNVGYGGNQKNVLHGSAPHRRHHRGDAPPRRPVRSRDHPGDDPPHSGGPGGHGPRLAHADARSGPPRRDAALEADRQPLPDGPSRTSPWGRSFAECHTGYRAYSRHFLETVPFLRNANGFVFDTEVIFQPVQFQLPVVEVPVESRYFEDASSVGFRQGVVYGLGTLWTALRFVLHRSGLAKSDKFRR